MSLLFLCGYEAVKWTFSCDTPLKNVKMGIKPNNCYGIGTHAIFPEF
jgi:hypothetical protein